MKKLFYFLSLVIFLFPGNAAFGSDTGTPKTNRIENSKLRGTPERMEANSVNANQRSQTTGSETAESEVAQPAHETKIKETKSSTGDVLGYIGFGLGLGAATFGLLAFLLPYFAIFGILLGIAGIIVSAIAKKKEPKKKVFAKVGLICGILGTILSIAAIVVWVIIIATWLGY